VIREVAYQMLLVVLHFTLHVLNYLQSFLRKQWTFIPLDLFGFDVLDFFATVGVLGPLTDHMEDIIIVSSSFRKDLHLVSS